MSKQEETFIVDSLSPDRKWLCVFEDDGETGYLYLCPMKTSEEMEGKADALWIYNQISPPISKCEKVHIIWSDDSLKAMLIVDGEGWGMFDLSSRRKLNAPRIDNSIVSIPLATWNEGIQSYKGEQLYLEVTNG